jgi:hypothetical protein
MAPPRPFVHFASLQFTKTFLPWMVQIESRCAQHDLANADARANSATIARFDLLPFYMNLSK